MNKIKKDKIHAKELEERKREHKKELDNFHKFYTENETPGEDTGERDRESMHNVCQTIKRVQEGTERSRPEILEENQGVFKETSWSRNNLFKAISWSRKILF